MNKHIIVNLLFLTALCALLLLEHTYPVSYGWYALLALLYTSVIAVGSYFISLNFFTYSYCHGDRQRALISITFDDGPADPHTALVLDILKKENIPATFFCIGKNITGNENLLKRMDDEGHLIGTHSFYHDWWFPLQSKTKIADEIISSQKYVSHIIQRTPLLFRPPFGVTDPRIAGAIEMTGVKSIGWSVRSYDTVISSPEKLLKRLENIKNGDTVLFHEAGLQTIAVLPMFIKYVRSQGFEIVPLPKLLGIDVYEE